MRMPEVSPEMRDGFDRARGRIEGNLFYRAYRDFMAHDGTIYAAAITFYALLSMVPFVIFLVAVLGLIIRDPSLQARVVDQIVSFLPADANLDEPIANAVKSVANTESSLVGMTAIIAAGWTASGVFGALRRALNRAFDVPVKRSFIRSRLTDVAAVLALALMLLASTLLTITLSVVRAFALERFGFVWSNWAWSIVFLVLPAVLSFIVFLLAYRWVPSHTLSVRDLWPGALMAALGFEALKIGFSWYVAKFADYDRVYGALGGLISFMAFVYFAAALVIFAAEVSREMAARHTIHQD